MTYKRQNQPKFLHALKRLQYRNNSKAQAYQEATHIANNKCRFWRTEHIWNLQNSMMIW